jgi:hypothetical protein
MAAIDGFGLQVLHRSSKIQSLASEQVGRATVFFIDVRKPTSLQSANLRSDVSSILLFLRHVDLSVSHEGAIPQ